MLGVCENFAGYRVPEEVQSEIRENIIRVQKQCKQCYNRNKYMNVKKLNEIKDRRYVSTAHVSQLKIWNRRDESDSQKDTDGESESEEDESASVAMIS